MESFSDSSVDHATRLTESHNFPDDATGSYLLTNAGGIRAAAVANDLANRAVMGDEKFHVAFSGKPWWIPQTWWDSLVTYYAKRDEITPSGVYVEGLTDEQIAVDMAEALQPRTMGAIADAQERALGMSKQNLAGTGPFAKLGAWAKWGFALGGIYLVYKILK